MFYIILVLALSGCSTFNSKPVVVERVVTIPGKPIPGTVGEYWVEPLYQDAKVPGQLDPEGMYYRTKHKAVVETYPGRYQENGRMN